MHSFIHSKVMEGVPYFKFRSRDPDHAHFGANLWSACKNSPASMCARNSRSVASSVREILRGSRNLEIGHVPQATPTWGQFLVCGQEEPRIHVHTKFEECSFIRYRDIEGVPKFRNWARTPGHAHLRPICGPWARRAQDPCTHRI